MLKMLKHLTKKEWIGAFFALGFIILQVWLDLKLPDYMSTITRLTQTPGSEISEIWRAGIYMLLCALGSVLAAIAIGFFAARIGASFSKEVRSKLFNRVSAFSLEEINQFSTSSLITRSTNDITQVQVFITIGMQMLVKAPIMAVWALFKIYGKGHEWTLATGIAVVIIISVIAIIMSFAIPKFKMMQTLTDNVNRVARENLTGLAVVRAYNAEDFQEEKFEEANEALTSTQLFTGRIMSLMMPAMSLVMSGLSLSIYWIGAYLINAANMLDEITLFSNMVVFSSYAMQVVLSFMFLSMMFVMLPRATVSANRISEVLETEPKIKDGPITEHQGDGGTLEFRNVSFRYPEAKEDVLTDINFSVNKGETLAFIGSTGSGKSTLLNLVPRLFDPTEGEILLDGINIKDYALEILHEKVGYVPQKAVLFKGTLTENIAFGDRKDGSFSDGEVRKALAIAQGTNIAEQDEEGYDAAISQGGSNLSGGQKQRVAIARAVARKPEIYLFDDSFSALDYKTDRDLRKALKEETQGVTILIVAQRIGTIMDAEQIIVLDEGKIKGKGTHEELLGSCEIYQEIARSQLSEEELHHE